MVEESKSCNKREVLLKHIITEYTEHKFTDLGSDSCAVVRAFLPLFAKEKYAGRIVLVNSINFRNRKEYGMSRNELYKVFYLDSVETESLVKTCVSHGCMSVLFLPKLFSELLTEYFKFGYYHKEGQSFNLKRDGTNNTFLEFQMTAYSELLKTDIFDCFPAGCSFSHDADFFCTMRFGQED
ncbi:MAG TPA: hypothetical protein VMY59_05215 [Candidatus Thermoplasmatota archaeon]|nr:hypothetical protein [Candidatus Thermoplasmatota archaeon]